MTQRSAYRLVVKRKGDCVYEVFESGVCAWEDYDGRHVVVVVRQSEPPDATTLHRVNDRPWRVRGPALPSEVLDAVDALLASARTSAGKMLP